MLIPLIAIEEANEKSLLFVPNSKKVKLGSLVVASLIGWSATTISLDSTAFNEKSKEVGILFIVKLILLLRSHTPNAEFCKPFCKASIISWRVDV